MPRCLLGILALVLFAIPVTAQDGQSADEIVAKYIKAVGGIEKIQTIKTLRRTGKFTGGGGFEATFSEENKRENKVRQEFSIQGLTGVNAYDGKTGWKIEPWQGKKDAEPLGEEEMKQVLESADFDGALVNYRQKGNKVEYLGMEPVEGTDAYKLKVTLANGDVRYYFMDTDYYVPIKIESKLMVRGAEREFEMTLGDYKEVDGWYLPYSMETNVKGSQDKSQITFQKIQANVPIDDRRFEKPVLTATQQPGSAPDASTTPPRKPELEKPAGQTPPQPKPPKR